MICETCYTAMSARLDGEDPGVSDEAIEAHLAQCANCRHRLLAATRVTRRVRVAPAEPVPDLSAAIMAGFPADAGAVSGRSRVGLLRAALAVVAASQLAGAVLLVLLDQAHVRHEVAAWNLALGLSLAAVAWQVRRAAGLLPLLAGLVVAMGSVELVDGLRHGFHPPVLAAHSLLVVALVLVWLLARNADIGGEDTPQRRSSIPGGGPQRSNEAGRPIAWPGGAVPLTHRRTAA
jgi:predicted anti-sigma-YlaC factor YlaD